MAEWRTKMFLDEKLLQIEIEQEKREKQEKHLEEIKQNFIRQEKEQKSIDDWISELKQKTILLDGKEYLCEKNLLLNQHVEVFTLSDDVERIIEENNIATIFYRTLEIGTNITFWDQPAVIKNETEFQQKLTDQYLKDKITYYPLETGNFLSTESKVCYAEGILTSAVGGIFINNFYCSKKEGTITGNYTCTLLKRYSFEHLFRAMICLMFEEDK